jgi:sulfite exporter TauE/SafE/copper chaperone CopZ
MVREIIEVLGMTCNNCVNHIEGDLKGKVTRVKASYVKGQVEVEYDPEKISRVEIEEIISNAGYEVRKEGMSGKRKKIEFDSKYIAWGIVILSVLFMAYFLYGYLDSLNLSLPEMGDNTSLFLLFVVGLFTGFHCVSMCGGFVVSYTTKNAIRGHKGMGQHFVYGLSKTASYTIIGGLFGLIGSIFFFSPALRGGIAIFAGLFMIAYSLSMFGIKFFRRFQFNPKFLMKLSSANRGTKGIYSGPMVTGLLNGLFIACGPLQAMYIYAAGTGSVIQGATSLMAFGLGTLPVLIGFGGLANSISHKATRKILKVSAVIVLILGVIMLNRGLSLSGSGYDAKSIIAGVKGVEGLNSNVVIDEDGYQVIEMHVVGSGYEPNSFVLQKGVPTRWVIYGDEITGCNNAIQVPSIDLEFDIKSGKQVIEMEAFSEEGVVSWSCWMGMIPGNFIVVEADEVSDIDATSLKAVNEPVASGGCGCGGGNSCGA